jgi:hypothetical protein
MRRYLAAAIILAMASSVVVLAGGGDGADPKEALQALQDFIGTWNGSGTSEKDRSVIWKEKVNWSWRFKGKDAWLVMAFPQGKNFKRGEIRYLPDDERYQLTLENKEGKKHVFLGQLKKSKLVLERKDAETKETQQIAMNIAGGGVRMVYAYFVKPENRTLFNKRFQVDFTKEGESFGTAAKKVECVVTGGLGTMPVSYNGATYYVCCSGCRDAFNENPEKIIKEYLAKKKKNQ